MSRSLLAAVALLTLLLPPGCAPPPAPAAAPQESALAMLTVTAAGVPLYAQASNTAPVLASLQSGARLSLLERQGEWLFVRTAPGTRGWVQASSLIPSQCLTDRPEPVIVEEPVFQFDEDRHGKVVLEAEYTADAQLAAARVLENTVGDPSYEQRAIDDLRKLRFLPPTEDCKARPFFYTFTREF